MYSYLLPKLTIPNPLSCSLYNRNSISAFHRDPDESPLPFSPFGWMEWMFRLRIIKLLLTILFQKMQCKQLVWRSWSEFLDVELGVYSRAACLKTLARYLTLDLIPFRQGLPKLFLLRAWASTSLSVIAGFQGVYLEQKEWNQSSLLDTREVLTARPYGTSNPSFARVWSYNSL